ncbi:MAG: thermonuclease family protein [Treponematales bacterium]
MSVLFDNLYVIIPLLLVAVFRALAAREKSRARERERSAARRRPADAAPRRPFSPLEELRRFLEEGQGAGNAPAEAAAVISAVVDGDTVDVVFKKPPEGCEQKERVRLIGVNTPELTGSSPEYYAEEARDFTNRWRRTSVRVGFDRVSSRRDVYGRLLAYVYLEDGTALNELLIREGYGRYYDNFAFEEERMKAFALAEEEVRKTKRGLWDRALSSRRKMTHGVPPEPAAAPPLTVPLSRADAAPPEEAAAAAALVPAARETPRFLACLARLTPPQQAFALTEIFGPPKALQG